MGWKIPVSLATLLTVLCICAAAETERDPRQTPPPGRALPPAPELSNGGTVSAPAPSSVEGQEPAMALQPQAAEAKLPVPLAQPKAQPKLRFGAEIATARRFAALALSGSRGNSPPLTAVAASAGQAPAEPAAPAPGRLAKQSLAWRRLQQQAALPVTVAGDLAAARTLSTMSLLNPLSATAGLPSALLDLSANFALAAPSDPSSAGFAGGADPLGAPIEMMLPKPPPRMPLPAVSPSVCEIARGNPKLKRIALTFDDGPHPEYTSQLLAILAYYKIPATFCVVGVQAQKNPQWVKMIAQSGNEIANHSYDHFRMTALPEEEKVYQIDENQRLIERLTGITPRFFRPPGGRYDPALAKMLRERGMVLALWDVAPNDTAEDREAADLLKSAVRDMRPGSIVLMHDGIQGTLDMLPGLIESLQKQGYDFVTLSELAAGV